MHNTEHLLLVSNSTNAGEEYLSWPIKEIGEFWQGVKRVAFVPYAGVTFSHDDYVKKVQKRFDEIGVEVVGVHTNNDPREVVEEAEAIVVGGGNTWRLLQLMQNNDLLDAIRRKVNAGTRYVGWSAGANVACPTIRTTNDMPITEPRDFNALSFVPFQINPHYLDVSPTGHGGETREDRIMEFIEVNRFMYVVGLREGCLLEVKGGKVELRGKKAARIFHYGKEPMEVQPGGDLQFLMA